MFWNRWTTSSWSLPFFVYPGETAQHGSREQKFERAVAYLILRDSINRARNRRDYGTLHKYYKGRTDQPGTPWTWSGGKIRLLSLGINKKNLSCGHNWNASCFHLLKNVTFYPFIATVVEHLQFLLSVLHYSSYNKHSFPHCVSKK